MYVWASLIACAPALFEAGCPVPGSAPAASLTSSGASSQCGLAVLVNDIDLLSSVAAPHSSTFNARCPAGVFAKS
eukprot:4475046-Pyramimonas_sp.AAC.1